MDLGVIYVIETEDLDSTARAVERLIGAPMEARESLYHGGDYYVVEHQGGHIYVQSNRDLVGRCAEQAGYRESATLVQVYGPAAEKIGKQLESLLPGLARVASSK